MNTEAATQPAAVDATKSIMDSFLLGNDYTHWSYLLIAIFAAYVIGKIVGIVVNLISAQFKKKGRPAMAALLSATGRTLGLFSIVLGLDIGLHFLTIAENVAASLQIAIALLLTIVGGLYAWRLVEVATAAFENYASKTEGKMDDMLVPIIRTGLRVVVIVLFVVQFVQILSHQQLSSVLAGLGIGGLAFALAAQDSIKNIFGSMVIIADKPFMIDERILVDSVDGVVEEVGLRSTRIRTMTGNLVTIPNGELANKTVENVGRRARIKRSFDVNLTYDMTPEQILRAKKIIEEILAVEAKQLGRTEGGDLQAEGFKPRIYFKDFATSSLNISVIYWYNSTNYWDYMAYSEWFNFELLKRFNAEGIDMAFPTQTLYLAGDPKRPLNTTLGGNPPAATKA